MIPRTVPLRQEQDWQSQLSNVISSADQLLNLLDLLPADLGYAPEACRDFALKVPLAFARRMR